MFRKTVSCAVAVGLLMTAGMLNAQGVSSAGVTADHAREEANKKLAAEFFRKGITLEERLTLLHPDYIQHNPMFKRFNEINGMQGPAGFAAMIKVVRAAAAAPPPPPPAGNDPTYMMVAEGDLVTVIQKRETPDPQYPGKTYESFWFETWRVKDGKLYEHWDAATIPEKIPDHLKAPQPK
jgi:predicted SnoaL-like aldol condensation-catalyzing enzyme